MLIRKELPSTLSLFTLQSLFPHGDSFFPNHTPTSDTLIDYFLSFQTFVDVIAINRQDEHLQ